MRNRTIKVLFFCFVFLSGATGIVVATSEPVNSYHHYQNTVQNNGVVFSPPENLSLTIGERKGFNSSVNWNNPGETTHAVTWGGCGAEFLATTNELNPVFRADIPDNFFLTQTIESNQGKKLVSEVQVSVAKNQRYDFVAPEDLYLSKGRSSTFQSDIQWKTTAEVTANVSWSGTGANYLSNLNTLNPTFNARLNGGYHLTQRIESTQGRIIETSVSIQVDDLSSPVSNIQASRFLQQATFGPSLSSIQSVKMDGYEQWIAKQIKMPPAYHVPVLIHKRNEKFRWEAWSKQSTYAPDQLRQRMAFALSEILTVSFRANTTLYNNPGAVTDYYDTLLKNGLGHFNELLYDVTRHPVMGIFLTYKGNTAFSRPDENYARELMQLFTIGLSRLNIDGTYQTDVQGERIPTYTQKDIEQLAKVFTGLCFAKPDRGKFCHRFAEGGTFHLPMVFWEDKHDRSQKIILDNFVVPANQTGEQDLRMVINYLALHPNTAPFISKQLIMRLVTSNPSADYVERVARVFKNSQGDLAQVAQAILLDSEARFGQHENSFGKIREPLIKLTHLFRALDAPLPASGQFTFGNKTLFNHFFGQAPLYAPSVFNFFMPDYAQGEVANAGLVAPELQLLNTSQLVVTENKFLDIIFDRPRVHYPTINLTGLQTLYDQQGVETLIERLNLLFTSGLMSECMKATIRRQIAHMKMQGAQDWIIKNVLAFVMQSPEFTVQR